MEFLSKLFRSTKSTVVNVSTKSGPESINGDYDDADTVNPIDNEHQKFFDVVIEYFTCLKNDVDEQNKDSNVLFETLLSKLGKDIKIIIDAIIDLLTNNIKLLYPENIKTTIHNLDTLFRKLIKDLTDVNPDCIPWSNYCFKIEECYNMTTIVNNLVKYIRLSHMFSQTNQ